jgi:hypothetical protein
MEEMKMDIEFYFSSVKERHHLRDIRSDERIIFR